MTPKERSQIATNYLFTNGAGQKAVRLVLEGRMSRDIGGWGFDVVADVIERQIEQASQYLQDRITELEARLAEAEAQESSRKVFVTAARLTATKG